jgi:hypothetical protein
LALLLAPIPFLAAHADTPTAAEYSVKAAYLYNFAKFVEWPAEVLPEGPGSLNLCIVGHDPFGSALEAIAAKTVRNHPVRVFRFSEIKSDNRCHLAFFSASESVHMNRWLAGLAGRPVLTVSDLGGFAGNGGMIGLVQEGPYIRFEINLSAARRARLRISSQLLNLARLVGDR